MIAVIICRQIGYCFVECPVFIFCQLIDFQLEISKHFFLGNTADGSIFRLKADIAQIIKYREERDLRKLGDAGDEDKFFVFILCFQDCKYFSIDICTCFMLWSLPGMLQRGVVFIDKNGNLLSGFVVSCFNDILESYGKRTILAHNYSVLRFKSIENIVQVALYTFRLCSCLTHIQSDDWSLYPFRLQLHNL